MRKALSAILCLLTLLITGCPAGEKGKEKPAQTRQAATDSNSGLQAPLEADPLDGGRYPGRVHVVEPKDTLFHLAERYYGDRNQWRTIWQANKKRLTNPNDLPVGMKLIIP